MREAEKVECLGLPFSTPLPVVDRKRTKFQQPRFLGMQFQVELPHSFREFRPELFGIRFALESNHDIVSESHDDNIAVRPLLRSEERRVGKECSSRCGRYSSSRKQNKKREHYA